MQNKTIYWIPVIGIFVTLMKYEEDNGMGAGWMAYQTLALMGLIAGLTLFLR